MTSPPNLIEQLLCFKWDVITLPSPPPLSCPTPGKTVPRYPLGNRTTTVHSLF